MSRGEVGYVSSLACQLPHTRTNSPAEFLLELGRHDISRTTLTLGSMLILGYHTSYKYSLYHGGLNVTRISD